MSYVDEVIAKVVEKNPAQPEFHQAVKEVLESLKPIVDANEEKYRKEALLERLVEPERQILFRVPWSIQGRNQTSSISKHRYYQVPWIRADFQKLPDRTSNRRR